jgi:hypothetical protein
MRTKQLCPCILYYSTGEPTQQPPELDACLISIVDKLELFQSPYKDYVEGTYSIGDTFIYLGQYQWVEGGPWMLFVAALPNGKPTGWLNARDVAIDNSSDSCSSTNTIPITDTSSILTATSNTVENSTIVTDSVAPDISTERFTPRMTSGQFPATLIDATTITRSITDTSSAVEGTSDTNNYSTTVTESVGPAISAGTSSLQMTQDVTFADLSSATVVADTTAVGATKDSGTSTIAMTDG